MLFSTFPLKNSTNSTNNTNLMVTSTVSKKDSESYAKKHWRAITIGTVIGFIVLVILIGALIYYKKRPQKVMPVRSIREFIGQNNGYQYD